MSVILGTLFLGISYLTAQIGAVYSHDETVISQLARTVYDGRGLPYLATIGATTVILLMAANTAFADFPRLSALAAQGSGTPFDDEPALAKVAAALDIRFAGEKIFLAGQDVSDAVRSEACGTNASRIAAFPLLREALLKKQRDFKRLPGLVADGRDMGSVVFPDADLKVFLTATAEARADRFFARGGQR